MSGKIPVSIAFLAMASQGRGPFVHDHARDLFGALSSWGLALEKDEQAIVAKIPHIIDAEPDKVGRLLAQHSDKATAWCTAVVLAELGLLWRLIANAGSRDVRWATLDDVDPAASRRGERPS